MLNTHTSLASNGFEVGYSMVTHDVLCRCTVALFLFLSILVCFRCLRVSVVFSCSSNAATTKNDKEK